MLGCTDKSRASDKEALLPKDKIKEVSDEVVEDQISLTQPMPPSCPKAVYCPVMTLEPPRVLKTGGKLLMLVSQSQ